MLTRREAIAVAVERALAQDYLVAPASPAARALETVPAHPRWHAPLLSDCAGDGGLLSERIEAAGGLWAGCFDLTGRNLLIVVNRVIYVSFVFQRVQGPRGQPLFVGP